MKMGRCDGIGEVSMGYKVEGVLSDFRWLFLKRMGCMGYHKMLMFSTRLSGNTRFQQFKTMKLPTETLRAKTRTLRPLPPSI